MSDNRRLVFSTEGNLSLVDTLTGRVREILGVAVSENSLSQPELSRDNRSIYFGLAVTEADVWLLTLQ